MVRWWMRRSHAPTPTRPHKKRGEVAPLVPAVKSTQKFGGMRAVGPPPFELGVEESGQ